MARAERWMRRALQLAARAQGRTAPNPMVGAVVVRDGACVGEGYHHRAGEPHAEALALAAAGPLAAGADLYVTLEPCAHHGRTPPCVNAVLRAGVGRVFAAMRDPDERVAGRGIEELRRRGVAVEVGLLEPEARALNEAYMKFKQRGVPFVTLKVAMTLDGKIASATGDSRWVTGEAARRYAHRLRDRHDAVLVGIGTARADDPLLTARLPGARNPMRVILDTCAALPLESALARTAPEVPTLLACGPDPPAERARVLAAQGVELLPLPLQGAHPSLDALLRALARRSVMSLLVEGGAEVAASFLDAGAVDRLEFFLAPKIIGGRTAPGPVGGPGRPRMADALPIHNLKVRRLGQDYLISASLSPDGA
jgi:diaminohydroxyphosphoribosylaminopyrimidine deaminase / 5-amino-6-(5-phosphoribosylamino)uracil reductase